MTARALAIRDCAINTATLGFRQSLPESIEAIARAGFGGIAPWRRELQNESVASAARRIRECGLTVTGYCRSTYIPAPDRAAFLAGLEDNRRAIDEAAELGAACFVMVVGGVPEGSRSLPDARAQLAEGTRMLLEHARAVGVRLGLEPLHPMYAADRSVLNTLAQALDLAAAIEPTPLAAPSLGVVIDVYHVWWDPNLEADIARAGRERRIFAFHLSDWRRETRDMLNDRGMMGDGVIDLRSIRRGVQAAGYTGHAEVEIFSTLDWWRRAPEETLAACAKRLVSVC